MILDILAKCMILPPNPSAKFVAKRTILRTNLAELDIDSCPDAESPAQRIDLSGFLDWICAIKLVGCRAGSHLLGFSGHFTVSSFQCFGEIRSFHVSLCFPIFKFL